MKSVKEAYTAPVLTARGTIEEMTKANTTGKVLDSNQQAGQVPLLS